jgi:hypothetical protein
MEHGTPPLRVFETRVSGVLDFRLSLSGHSEFQNAVWLKLKQARLELVFQSRTLAEPTTMATSPTNHDPTTPISRSGPS